MGMGVGIHIKKNFTVPMEYYSVINNWTLAIYDNMDGLWGYYAKWNEISEIEGKR